MVWREGAAGEGRAEGGVRRVQLRGTTQGVDAQGWLEAGEPEVFGVVALEDLQTGADDGRGAASAGRRRR